MYPAKELEISGNVTFPMKVDYYKCMKFRLNPTVREINRYLSPLIEELTRKHVKVSNPEFEEELKALTGIGWKQVKNYKNHPKPGQRLNDNASINEFVYKARKKDKKRTITINTALILLVIVSLFVCTKIYQIITQERVVILKQPIGVNPAKIAIKDITPTIVLSMPTQGLELKLGSLKNQDVDISTFSCVNTNDTLKVCQRQIVLEGAVFQTDLHILDGMIKTIMLTCVGENSAYVNDLLASIKAMPLLKIQLDQALRETQPITKFDLTKDYEHITVTITKHLNAKDIQMLQVILEYSL